MIESIEFTNFKALRKTTLPLAPFTLLLGPNGSGKTSVLQALSGVAAVAGSSVGVQREGGMAWASSRSITVEDPNAAVEIKLRLQLKHRIVIGTFQWHPNGRTTNPFNYEDGNPLEKDYATSVLQWLSRMQVYNLEAAAIAHPAPVNSQGNRIKLGSLR